MSRRLAAAAAALVALSACAAGPPGAGDTPECDVDRNTLESVTILQLQAVPEAAWGPCVEKLHVGWDYMAQEAKQGEARFWLASQSLGWPFLEVTLRASCDTSGAETRLVGREGVERLVDVDEFADLVRVVIIPVAPRHEERAQEIAATLHTGLPLGRRLQAVVDGRDESASVRMEEQLDEADAVIVVDDREVANGTVELRRPGHDPQVDISLSRATSDIVEGLPPVSYVANWYDRFDGGCITYRFDAHGEGATTVASDVDDALGLFPLSELRKALVDELGHDIVDA